MPLNFIQGSARFVKFNEARGSSKTRSQTLTLTSYATGELADETYSLQTSISGTTVGAAVFGG
jgi:hypothetical protein